MFVPYALAAGMALALVGLYCEVALYLGWSRRRKGWGGLVVAAATMGVVPAVSTEAGQIAVAAVCGSIVLVLSVRGNSHQVLAAVATSEPCASAESQHLYIDTSTASSFIATESSPALHLPPHQSEDPIDFTPLDPTTVEPTIETAEPELDAEGPVFVVAEPEFEAEEPVNAEARLELEADVPVIAVAEPEFEAEIPVFAKVEPMLQAEEPVSTEAEPAHEAEDPVSAEAEPELAKEPPVTPEWLNGQIARAYEAKATGEWQAALGLFEEAIRYCTDSELNAMFQEEIVQLRAKNPNILQAS